MSYSPTSKIAALLKEELTPGIVFTFFSFLYRGNVTISAIFDRNVTLWLSNTPPPIFPALGYF